MKSMFRASCVAVACSLSILGASTAQAADAVVLQLDWVPSGIASGWYYGVQQHCFADQNIDVTIKRGYGAGDAVTKVATGASTFGFTDFGAIIAARATSGAEVKGLLPIIPNSPFGVVVMDDSPVKTMKDLEGKTVASAPGDAGMQFLPIGMKLNGADFSKIKTQSSEPAALAGLLFQGRVDAITSYTTSAMSTALAAAQVGKKIRVLPFGQSLDIYNVSLFTSDKLIADNPGLVKRFYTAAVCSFDKARANVDASTDAMVAAVSGMQKDSQTELVRFSYKLAFDNATFKDHGYKWYEPRVAHTIALVEQARNIDKKLNPADFTYEVK